jgi:hypothetical protein
LLDFLGGKYYLNTNKKMSKKNSLLLKLKRMVYPKKGYIKTFKLLFHKIGRNHDKKHSAAIGVAAGVAVSFTPLVGFHILLAALICLLFGGNTLMSIIGTLAGNPVTFPIFWYLSHCVGSRIIIKNVNVHLNEFFEALFSLDFDLIWEKFSYIYFQTLAGGVVFGLIVFGVIYYLTLRFIEKYKEARVRKFKKKVRASKE